MFDTKSSDTSRITDLAEQAAQSAKQALQSTGHKANQALTDTVAGLSHTTSALLQSGKDRLHDASDGTVRFIKDEPIKAVLIAAATGAALLALASLLARQCKTPRD